MESGSSTWFLVNISMCAVWCILCEAECPGGLRKLPDSKGQKNMGLTYQAPRSPSLSPRPPPSLPSSPPSSLLSAALSDAPVPIHFWVMSIHFSSQPLSWKWDFSSPWTQSICLHKVFLSPSHNDASENKLLGAPPLCPMDLLQQAWAWYATQSFRSRHTQIRCKISEVFKLEEYMWLK